MAGAAESVPSYQVVLRASRSTSGNGTAGARDYLPSWMAEMLGCVFHFCCHVVAGGRCGLFPPPPASRWVDFVLHPPVGVLPALSQALGCLTDRCVVVAEYASVSLPDDGQSSHLRRFSLPASSFAEDLKSESTAVFGTVLSFGHRLGVIWVQTSSKTYCLLQLGSSRSSF